MSYAGLRNQFLHYFQALDHRIVSSSSLLPPEDSALLFTNAGMNQFTPAFLGIDRPVHSRVVSAQRCVRAGGKHNDLENVGYTARHHTFFEMLGNFSFGDYFKEQAISYAWTFVTQHLNLPIDRLWVTVHYNDEESVVIWHKHIGVPLDRIVRCSDKDNFWAMGDQGPCGPCTEIFYDHGPSVAGGPPGSADADGDRYMEIWNLVFMQYDRQADGTLIPLPKPCVDTGMGLERLACVSEQVFSNFDTSLFVHLKKPLAQRTKAAMNDPRLNVIADHLRAATFIIADGMTPSAEGRGYVLRRLIRRALSHGYMLGLRSPFLYEYVPLVVEEMSGAYPFLLSQNQLCKDVICQEEQVFHRTLQGGFKYAQQTLSQPGSLIKGSDLFKLYDTYGFPLDIARDLAIEHDRKLDLEGFESCMQKQRALSKGERKEKQWTLSELPTSSQEFIRDQSTIESKILAVYEEPHSPLTSWVCFDKTIFYAESGGQEGDQGSVQTTDQSIFTVLDTQKALHMSMALTDRPAKDWIVGETVTLLLDTDRRHRLACHHTATHLLHAALHKVISPEIRQRGSLVAADRLRFDISCDKPLTELQKSAVEDFCQKHIDEDCTVSTTLMSQDEAIASGALAFFGEKYGSQVRVLSIGHDVSRELCGGTHISQLASLRTVIIVSDEALSAGVRRLQAVAGPAAIEWLRERSAIVYSLENRLKVNASQLEKAVYDLQQQCQVQLEMLVSIRKERLFQKLRTLAIRNLGERSYVLVHLLPEEKPYLNEAADFIHQLPVVKEHLSPLTVCLSVCEEKKYTILLTQSQGTLDFLVEPMKKNLGLKGGGRSNRVQLGGMIEGSLEELFISFFQ